MIKDIASVPTKSVSRILGWGRFLLATGGALLFLAIGAQLAGSPRIDAAAMNILLGCGASGIAAGVILTALGVVDQRLIETRALLLTAVQTLNAAEALKADAPLEPLFRSRPAARLRASRR